MAKKTTVVKKDTPKTIGELKRDYAELKRSNASRELVNVRAITTLRKEIARLMTQEKQNEINKLKENK